MRLRISSKYADPLCLESSTTQTLKSISTVSEYFTLNGIIVSYKKNNILQRFTEDVT